MLWLSVIDWYFYMEWLVLSIFSQQLIWRSSGGAWQSHLYCYLTLIKWVHHIAQQSQENPTNKVVISRNFEWFRLIRVQKFLIWELKSAASIKVGFSSGLWLWLRANDYSVSIFNAATAWHRYNRVMARLALGSRLDKGKRKKIFLSTYLKWEDRLA